MGYSFFEHKNKTPEGVFVILINKKTPRQKPRRIPGQLKNRHTVLVFVILYCQLFHRLKINTPF